MTCVAWGCVCVGGVLYSCADASLGIYVHVCVYWTYIIHLKQKTASCSYDMFHCQRFTFKFVCFTGWILKPHVHSRPFKKLLSYSTMSSFLRAGIAHWSVQLKTSRHTVPCPTLKRIDLFYCLTSVQVSKRWNVPQSVADGHDRPLPFTAQRRWHHHIWSRWLICRWRAMAGWAEGMGKGYARRGGKVPP